MRFDERIYRALLRAYPVDFRQAFGAGMVEMFRHRRDQARRRGGPGWRARFWTFVLRDLARSAWAERRTPLGSMAAERGRPTRRGGGMEGLWQDLRYTLRRLVRAPAFAGSALVILTLAIGVNSAVFSVVNALLFQPPPFEEPDRVVELLQDSRDGVPNATSLPAYRDIRAVAGLFEEVGAHVSRDAVLDLDGVLTPVLVDWATASYLPTLGLVPSRGRWFAADEDVIDGPPAAVVSHTAWRTLFASDPDILGRTLRVNAAPVTVVGVGPTTFDGGVGPVSGDLWLSVSAMRSTGGPARSWDRREDHPATVVARMAPGVTLPMVEQAMLDLSGRLAREFPDINEGRVIHVLPSGTLPAERRGSVVSAAALAGGLVGIVLLVASINLANLLLVRGLGRRRELALRMALGGARRRVVRVLLSESVVLALAGGVLGLGLAAGILDLVGRTRPQVLGVPIVLNVHMDWRVVAFTVAVAVGASLLAGLLPALRVTRPGLISAVHEGTRDGSPSGLRLTSWLVAGQVAASMVLLVAAGLFVGQLLEGRSADPGFDAEGLAVLRVNVLGSGLDGTEVRRLWDDLEQRMERTAGVRSATYSIRAPVALFGTTTLLLADPADGVERPVEIPWNQVDPDYFETLGIPLLHGRLFDERDGPDDPARAVVSEAMARSFWGRTDIVGESYRSENRPDDPVEIIGVVATTKVASLFEGDRPTVYWSTTQGVATTVYFLARSVGSGSDLLGPLQAAARATDSRITVLEASTMNARLGASLSRERLRSGLLVLIGLLGLCLATLGIYSVISFGVSRRQSEIGVRMALGAPRGSVVRLFLGEAVRVVGIGALLGLALAVPLSRFLGVAFLGDPSVPLGPLSAALATMCVAALVATLLPAVRAARLDPALTLRQE